MCAVHAPTGRPTGAFAEGPVRDAVTELPGRRLLLEHLRLATARARAGDDHVVVLDVGLDGLDLVTAGLGYGARDTVLREVASRLRRTLADTALVAHVGDGQFAVMLADIEGAAEQIAETAAGQVIVAAGRALDVDGERFELRARVGASVFPGDAADPEGLLRHAEAAMREAPHRERARRVLRGRHRRDARPPHRRASGAVHGRDHRGGDRAAAPRAHAELG